MKQISELSTGYAIRLYELLISWRTTGRTLAIELSEFRQKMGVLDSEYQRMHDLKKRVLEPALEQINDHTDITASYEQYKKGRLITGFSFKFKHKKQNSDKTPLNSDSSPPLEKMSQLSLNIEKQPKNAKTSDLERRARSITGVIAKFNLVNRFQHGSESPVDMMKRIQSEMVILPQIKRV